MIPSMCVLAICSTSLLSSLGAQATGGESQIRSQLVRELDPRGKAHIPIGIANTLDSLKTFVEAEGNFSPGVGSYGIYFWLYDNDCNKLSSPTMDAITCEHGLTTGTYLIPRSQWSAGPVRVRSEVCHVLRDSPFGEVHVVAARVTIRNTSDRPKNVSLYAALRPVGPAGFDVGNLCVAEKGDALLVDGRAALLACEQPSGAGVLATDTIGELATRGEMPGGTSAESLSGDCCGALRFDLTLAGTESKTFSFLCPVLPGRRAVRHRWDGVSDWAQFDLAKPNPPSGGVLQPDPGLQYYRELRVDKLFVEAELYWKQLVGVVRLRLPDRRWSDAFAATAGHAAMAMNEGAPDVAVVNYNVFNRDGVYVANILQKAGRCDFAAEAIDYFSSHPFNGRSYPEADNPGQILWIMGEHWRFTHDDLWLDRIYPSVRKIAEMIRYYRTTAGPHWVQMDSLDFGEQVAKDKRRELKPGRCDGHNPAYTEAFDLAGIRAAAVLAEAAGRREDAAAYRGFAELLLEKYDKQYGHRLSDGYGSYSVLWPCRIYPFVSGKAEQFKDIAAQKPQSWRYFPLAKAHQSLLAGNREAGYGTLEYHLDHPQMHGWYAFDEGGRSGSGGWGHLRTTWDGSVAMPHGWAIAELHLLLRDCLAYEDGGQLVLFAGVPETWLTHNDGMSIDDLPTHFGSLSLQWKQTGEHVMLTIGETAKPPKGFALRLPGALRATVWLNERTVEANAHGDFVLPTGTKRARVEFRRR
ncbi:MAG: hypothetical protein JSU70_09935 [Phycisphaerales bacterium]|nr:MAG: hypothetical protein JSU70_09935 [Phycisphaerales bacterium]